MPSRAGRRVYYRNLGDSTLTGQAVGADRCPGGSGRWSIKSRRLTLKPWDLTEFAFLSFGLEFVTRSFLPVSSFGNSNVCSGPGWPLFSGSTELAWFHRFTAVTGWNLLFKLLSLWYSITAAYTKTQVFRSWKLFTKNIKIKVKI